MIGYLVFVFVCAWVLSTAAGWMGFLFGKWLGGFLMLVALFGAPVVFYLNAKKELDPDREPWLNREAVGDLNYRLFAWYVGALLPYGVMVLFHMDGSAPADWSWTGFCTVWTMSMFFGWCCYCGAWQE
jgi:hypothetical protein